MRLTDAVRDNSYARRMVTEEDIYTMPPSAMTTMPPRVGEWIVTSRELVERWTLPGIPPPSQAEMGFWYAGRTMRHVRNLQQSEWRFIHRREDWEPWEFFKYLVVVTYRDPRAYIVWDRPTRPRWLLGND